MAGTINPLKKKEFLCFSTLNLLQQLLKSWGTKNIFSDWSIFFADITATIIYGKEYFISAQVTSL